MRNSIVRGILTSQEARLRLFSNLVWARSLLRHEHATSKFSQRRCRVSVGRHATSSMRTPSYRGWSLGEFQRYLASIYSPVNEDRFGPGLVDGLSGMWLRVMSHAGEVARAVRKEEHDLLLRELPQLFCWYSTFCTKLCIDLEDVVWRFFPYICSTCYAEPCGCGPHKESESKPRPQKDPHLLAYHQRENLKRRPTTLDAYVQMFEDIYGAHDQSTHVEGVFLHLTEELGEVAKHIPRVIQFEGHAQRELINGELASELADVFSWICKLCFKTNIRFRAFIRFLNQHLPAEVQAKLIADIRLSTLIADVYRTGCPDCIRKQCLRDCPGWRVQGDQKPEKPTTKRTTTNLDNRTGDRRDLPQVLIRKNR
jgi:NTP pyrophosphatase (non-canonical NTP hydrolase)